MAEPQGFIDHDHPYFVCKLTKAFYGLKKSPHAWFQKLNSFLVCCGFVGSQLDKSMFLYSHGSHMLIVLISVDDIIIMGNHDSLITDLISTLHSQFALKDPGALSYFLSIEVTRTSTGFHDVKHLYIDPQL